MNLSRRVLVGLVIYLLAGVLLASRVLPPLAAALLAAPFALLLPAGVGLAACFGWRGSVAAGIGRVQALLVAWLFGTLAIIFVFVLLERHGLTGRFAGTALAFFYALAALGYVRLMHSFAPAPADWATVRLVAMAALPLVIVQYIAELPVYSDFPVLNLFQRTHFHKGALEFARFGMLNPFVADSYVPFQQLLLGLLARGAGVDPLVAEWVLPLVMSPLQVATIFAVASRVTRSKAQLGLAIGLFMAMSSVTNPTNGEIASLATLLLLSFMLNANDEDVSVREKLGAALFLVVPIAVGLVLLRVPAVAAFGVLLGAGLLASTPHVDPRVTRATIVSIAIFAALTFHRAAMLFLPMVVVIFLAAALYSRMHRRGEMRSLAAISVASVLLVGGMVGWTLLQGDHGPQDEFGLWSVFDVVLLPLAGKSMALVAVDHDMSQGAGGRVSLFEVARSLTVAGAVVGGFFFLRAMWAAITLRRTGAGTVSASEPGVVLMLVCLLLLAISLTGFPFVHRSAFLIIALLSIATAVLVSSPEAEGNPPRRGDLAGAIALLAYMGGVLALISLLAGHRYEPFIERISPLLLLLLVAGISTAGWCLLKNPKICLAATLVVAVSFEVIASRAYFKPYAFMNQRPAKGQVFSHFGHHELATADMIAQELDAQAVLVSDPKTMALLGARSGLNSLVSFSNVNTMADDTRRELGSLLRKVSRGASQEQICSGLQRIADSYASSQLNYERATRLGWVHSGGEALAALGYTNGLVPRSVAPPRIMIAANEVGEAAPESAGAGASTSTAHQGQPFAVVISPDTLDWIDRPLEPSYFPAAKDLSGITDALLASGSTGRKIGNAFLFNVRCG